MPYTIDYSTSSKTPIVVNDGTVDTSTSVSLIGKNYTRFGEILNDIASNVSPGEIPK